MASSAVDWLINNISKATRWRAQACQQFGWPCDYEGGVDVPLPSGTPIYALASGQLMGVGTFYMASGGGFGHGVVTENVPGVGQVYYQHIDLAPGLPLCASGNCGGYQVKAGQLIGYSTADIGEVEVGINPTWGGIWGTNTNNALWVADPRQELVQLANQQSSQSCSDLCKKYSGGNLSACIAGCQCAAKNAPTGTSTNCCGVYGGSDKDACIYGVAVGAATNTGDTAAGDPLTQLLSFIGDWIKDPIRPLKFILGVLGIGIALLVIFWPQGQVAKAVMG